MLKRHILTISLLLPFVAISATAQAGATISDKRYWPSEVGPGAYRAGASQTQFGSAFAWGVPRSVAPRAREGGYGWRYQGGPKSPITRAWSQ